MLTELSEQFRSTFLDVVAGFVNEVNTQPEPVTNAVDFTDNLHSTTNTYATDD